MCDFFVWAKMVKNLTFFFKKQPQRNHYSILYLVFNSKVKTHTQGIVEQK